MIGFLRFVVVAVLFLFVNVQADEPPPIITGVSGCQNVSSTRTINCPRPFALTITGSGFMSGGVTPKIWWMINITLIVPNTTTYYQCYPHYPGGIADDQFICDIPTTTGLAGYGKVVTDTLLTLRFENVNTQLFSELTQAMSFAHEYPPVVMGVSGCPIISADGRSASQCSLGDLITVYGANFSSVDYSYANLTIGTRERWLYLMALGGNFDIESYSDTTIVFRFDAGSSLNLAEALSGAFLPLILEEWDTGRPDGVPPLWFTEPVYISFSTFPPPELTTFRPVVGGGCQADNSTGSVRYRDCTTGKVELYAETRFTYPPLTATFDGMPLKVNMRGLSYTSFTFPIPPFQSAKGQSYDLTISSALGTIALPGILQFKHDPMINRTVPCMGIEIDGPRCSPGQTLVLKMYNIDYPSPTPQVWITYASTLFECPNAQVTDHETITCIMPAYPRDLSTYQQVKIYVEWPNGVKTAEFRPFRLWNPNDQPAPSSSSATSTTIALATVFSIVGAVLIAAGVMYKYRGSYAWFKRRGEKADIEQELASSSRHVTLTGY